MHKDAFLRTLSAYYEAQDLEPFRFLPLSFELPPLGKHGVLLGHNVRVEQVEF